MNPRPADALDRDALVEQLARLDSDNSSEVATPATVSGLKAELETLIVQLREPAGAAPYAEESGLRRAQELVLAIGVEPEPQSRSEPPEFGRIGPYELLEKLGEGGMGAVYKALHSSLEKIVALKVLPRDRLNQQAILRFKREMKAVGKLDHPNIVRATDAGEADGHHFLVMEYVDGVDLSELLRRVGPLAATEACEIVRQAAVGLQHAHQRGMVHRDIKPSNIMLAWSDEHPPGVKVLDMGLALLSEPVGPAPGELTVSGSIMGTLEYMSPEQSQDTHLVDIRTDIYSLGATLYKLLCGKAPLSGERFNTPGKLLVALATETSPSLETQRGDLPAGLIAIVDRMLARDPAERPATPAEVAQALVPFTRGSDLSRLANLARHPAMPSAVGEDQVLVPTAKLLSVPDTTSANDSASRAALAPGVTRTSSRPGADAARLAKIVFGVALCALIGGVLVFGGQLSRIVTNQGQIVIETDGTGIEIVLKDQAGKVLVDGETKREITFQAGEYNIEVTVRDSGGEERFVTDHFTLTRNGKAVVDARWKMAGDMPAAARHAIDSPSVVADRRAAEYVLSIGGYINFNGIVQPIGAVDDLPRGAFELTGLILEKNTKVSDAGLANFKGCRNLTSLYMHDAPISDAGLAYFKNCKSLKSLTLSGKNVTDLGLAHFKDCRNLTSLDLAGANLSNAGMAYFKDCKQLTDFKLHRTMVSDGGLAHFKDCDRLTSLLLFEMPVTDAGLAHFQNCYHLKSLSLFSRQLSDAGLASFRNCKDLEHLELSGMQAVSDAGVANFRNCKNLAILDLSNAGVSDEGIAHLEDCRNLTAINLNDTKISDAGLERLTELSKLRHLFAARTRVTEAGVKKLSAILPQARIEWDGGVIDPSVSSDRRAAEWVLSVYGRVTILVNGQEVKPGRVGDLPRDAFELTAAHLGSNPKVNDAGLAHFKDCQNLTTLDLERNKISDAGLAHFKSCKKLADLKLLGLRLVTDEGLSNFWGCENLTSLNLDSTQLTDSGLASFRNLKNLTSLNLSGTRVTDAGLSHLKDCQNLTAIDLAHTGVTDSGLANFEDCHNLMVLGLLQTQVSDAGLAHFKDFRNLFSVDLSSTQVTDAGLAHLRNCKNVTSLELRNVRVSDAALADLKSMSRLKNLDLADTRMSQRGYEQLMAALPGLKFDWSEPNRSIAASVLAVGGTVEISACDERESHPIKTVADLPRDYIQVRRVSLAGVTAPVIKLLPLFGQLRFPEFDRLESLDLSGITLPPGPQPFFFNFLAGIHGLRELNLADAGLNDESLFHLPKLPTLKRLVLDGCDLSSGNRGFSRLIDRTQLESLDLRRTNVSVTSIAQLKQALPNCKVALDPAEK